MLSFLILLFVMIGIWAIIIGASDTSEIVKNWDKYRCKPSIMPFASFFGHDTSENFQFCLQSIIKSDAGFMLSPIFQIVGTLLGTLGQLMQMANSIRLEFATMMGGINTIFQNFADRINQVTQKIKTTVMRTRMLMGRVYATFFALIYISISGITALQNFGDTILFKFLDVFCFDPDTPVIIKNKGSIPVKDVRIGDVFERTGGRVTSTFSFEANGQPMVEFPGEIKVSTNHFVINGGKYTRADEHPDAKPIADWAGGLTRPLICFNTSDHIIPIGNYSFLDYDETESGDSITMKWVEDQLNAVTNTKSHTAFDYSTVVSSSEEVRMKNNTSVRISNIRLGDETTQGRVIGLVQKEVTKTCVLPSNEYVTPGLLFWNAETERWIRAGEMYPIYPIEKPEIYYGLIVKTSGSFELKSGTMVRDYVEVHSPDSEQFYAKAIGSSSCVITE
jgi:hypothetical protein